jgi:hypothetical protein
MYFKQTALTILSIFFISFNTFAQDSTDAFYILETFNEDLNRSEQLETLDRALGEEFNLTYELKVLLQKMTDREKKYLLKYVYLKARKPMPITSDDKLVNYNIVSTFNKDLERGQQLDVLESSSKGEKFNLEKELELIMEGMDTSQTEDLLKFVYAKANKPLELKGKKPVAKIDWKEVEFNFGAVKKGKVVSHTFNFRNVSKVPYQIEGVDGSCGCTVAKYTEGIIGKYEMGEVIVTFNSVNKPKGLNTELVTITGNSFPEKVVLVINIDVY